MTEYLILAVSYSEEDKHIGWLLLARMAAGKTASISLASSSLVVDLIKTGCASFRTATVKNKKYQEGAEVIIYDDEYLTTAPDESKENNLENLPTFTMPNAEIDAALVAVADKIFGPLKKD